MKDFKKDFTNKEKRAIRKEFDNSSEVRILRKELGEHFEIYFTLFIFLILFGPVYLNDLFSIFLFAFITISGLISYIKAYRLKKKIEKSHLEDYTEWLKEKNIKY